MKERWIKEGRKNGRHEIIKEEERRVNRRGRGKERRKERVTIKAWGVNERRNK
jgi:hypothetical protein